MFEAPCRQTTTIRHRRAPPEPYVDLEREAAMMLARELSAAGWFWLGTGRDGHRVSKTLAAQQAHPRGREENMAWVPGGRFLMGSEDFYPEERPVRRVEVDGFWMDFHPVTVADFRRFVAATGYVTVAERPPDPSRYPGADPALLYRLGDAIFAISNRCTHAGMVLDRAPVQSLGADAILTCPAHGSDVAPGDELPDYIIR